jgi:hypothetical protein
LRKLSPSFNTSVFKGVYDVEFQEETEELFEMVKNGEIICVYPDLCEYELENVPGKVKKIFLISTKTKPNSQNLLKKLTKSPKSM